VRHVAARAGRRGGAGAAGRWGSFGAAVLALALALGGCAGPAVPAPKIAEISPPAPLPAPALTPLPAPFRVRVAGVDATVGIGERIELPRVDAVVEVPPAVGGDRARIHVLSLRLDRPRVTFPVDTVTTRLELFIQILEPRLVVDTLVVEGGEVGTLAAPWQAPGRWLWRLRELDLVARDVAVGGRGEAEGGRVVRAVGRGEVKGRPFALESAKLAVRRTARDLVADGGVDLGFSRFAFDFRGDRANRWRARITADTFALAELRAILPALPEEGSGSGVVAIRGGQEVEAVEVARLDVETGESRVAARGTILPEDDDVVLDGIFVEALPLYTADVGRLAGIVLPGGGAWTGWVAGDGGVRSGIALRGALVYRSEAGDLSRLDLGGGVRLDPGPVLDLEVRGAPVRAADTAFDATLRLRGPLPELTVDGEVAVRGVEEARAVADGWVVLEEGGKLEVRVVADPIPLAVLPWPAGVDSVRGEVAGVAWIEGTLDRPTVSGRFDVRRGGGIVEPVELEVEAVEGTAVFEEGWVTTEGLEARAGGGVLRLRGGVRLFGGPRRLDLELLADSVRVVDDDTAEVTLSADLGLAGPLEAPTLTGRIYDVHGWIRESFFRPSGPLDLDDPPYADLAREAPWPEGSRLRRVPPDSPLPVRGGITVEIDRDLRVVDEDSDLRGRGTMRIIAREEGWAARGVLRVEEGFYAFFGERFRVYGGAVRFQEDGFDPFVAILAEHEDGRVRARGYQETTTEPERFPPIEFLAYGEPATIREEVRRWSLLPATQPQLAELLIYGLEPQPVTGWRYPRFWRADDPADLFGERTDAQAAPLLWSYLADEAYDYLPIERVWLRAGDVVVGSRYPAFVVVGPVIGGGVTLSRDFEVFASQPLDGGVAPGLRARWRFRRGGAVEAFTEARFWAAPIEGKGHPGFFTRRKNGVGVRWRWEY